MRVLAVLVASLVGLGCQQRVCTDPDCEPVRAAVWAEDPGTAGEAGDRDRTDGAIGLVGRDLRLKTWEKNAKELAARAKRTIGVVWRYDPINNKSHATIGDVAGGLLRTASNKPVEPKPVEPTPVKPVKPVTPAPTGPVTSASPDAFFTPATPTDLPTAPLGSPDGPALPPVAPVLTGAEAYPGHPGLPRPPVLETTPVPTHVVGRRARRAVTAPATTSAMLELPPMPALPKAKPARFGYPQYLVQGYRGQPIAALRPNLSDARLSRFQAVDKLPEGLYLDPKSGLISGSPRQRCEERSYKLVALDRSGTTISNGQIRIRID